VQLLCGRWGALSTAGPKSMPADLQHGLSCTCLTLLPVSSPQSALTGTAAGHPRSTWCRACMVSLGFYVLVLNRVIQTHPALAHDRVLQLVKNLLLCKVESCMGRLPCSDRKPVVAPKRPPTPAVSRGKRTSPPPPLPPPKPQDTRSECKTRADICMCPVLLQAVMLGQRIGSEMTAHFSLSSAVHASLVRLRGTP
jgi:hypothetical protein